jgi:hypothetical protein
MRRPHLGIGLFLAVFAVALVAACSGGSQSSILPRHNPQAKIGYLHVKLFVPKKHRAKVRGRNAKLRGRKVRPHYLPATTTQVTFQLTAVDGIAQNPGSPYTFTIYTGGPSPQCTPSGSGAQAGYECSVTASAPAATDEYQITASSCDGATGNDGSCGYATTVVSESDATIKVPPNGNANAKFTLNPMVATLAWSVQTGNQAPAYSLGVYTCASPGPCWDPLLNGRAEAASHAVSLNAYDGTGAQIVAASGGGTVYDTPLYLQQNGTADQITWSCSDPTLTWTTGSGPYGYQQGVLANGEGSGAGVNSPVANPSPDTGYDFYGSPSPAIGNNGAEMNFSGANEYGSYYYSPYGGGPYTCTATDSQGQSAVYYAGDDLIHRTLYVANSPTAPASGVPSPPSISAIDLTKTPANALEYTFTQPFTGFAGGPEDIAVDDGGNLYVADYTGGAVYIYPFGSTTIANWHPFTSPVAILIDHADQELIVADSGTSHLDVFQAGTGSALLASFALTNVNNGDFLQLAMDKHGRLWVSDQQTGTVEAYTAPFSAGSIPSLTLGNSVGVVAPSALGYDSANDYLYVTNVSPTNNIVQFAAATGTPLRNSASGAIDPKAVAVDPTGNVLVANLTGTNSTYAFSSTLVQLGTSPLAASGNPAQPDALLFVPNVNPLPVSTPYPFGAVYVAESSTGHVVSYCDSGTTICNGASSNQYNAAQGVANPTALAFFDGNIAASGYGRTFIKRKHVSRMYQGCTKGGCRKATRTH